MFPLLFPFLTTCIFIFSFIYVFLSFSFFPPSFFIFSFSFFLFFHLFFSVFSPRCRCFSHDTSTSQKPPDLSFVEHGEALHGVHELAVGKVSEHLGALGHHMPRQPPPLVLMSLLVLLLLLDASEGQGYGLWAHNQEEQGSLAAHNPPPRRWRWLSAMQDDEAEAES